MEIITVEEINQYIGSTVNPLDNPDTVYELYSVPSFESQQPEIIKGKDIGSSKITVEDGDVLVCKINPRINRVWVVKRHTSYPLLASSEWIVIRNCDIDSDYLKWYFSSPTFRNLLVSQVAGIGGSLTRAQPKQVAKYPVPLVGKEEQHRIAALLDKVGDLITKRRAQLDKLDLLVKARFVEMFERGNYPKVKASEICDFITKGTTPPVEEIFKENSPSRIPFLKVYNLSFTGELLFEQNPQYIERNVHEGKLSRSKVYPNDVLMNIVGPPLGKFALIPKKYGNLNINQAIAIFRAREKILPKFLLAALMQPEVLKPFMGQAVGVRQQNLSLEQCRNLEISLPDIELQKQFVEFTEQEEKSKLTIQRSLDKLEILKKALMQQYFG